MSNARLGRRAAALLVALGSVTCSGEVLPPVTTHDVTLLVRADVSATAVATVVVEVTAPDIATPLVFNLTVTDGVASGTITVPAGSARTFTMRAFDVGGVQTHSGSTTVDVQPGANGGLTIVLVPSAGDVPIDVTLGEITIVVTPSAPTLAIGGTVQLSATVTDVHGNAVLDPVTWATKSPAVATVNATGLVTGEGGGTTDIVATLSGAAGGTTVTVN